MSQVYLSADDDTIAYDAMIYFSVRSKDDETQLIVHRPTARNQKISKNERKKIKTKDQIYSEKSGKQSVKVVLGREGGNEGGRESGRGSTV